ncbi:MAG: radical SAM family heme chaperone HemW [Crocinitomicaceae bacterium]
MSGIYVHIPFCKQKCSYCDFHFSTNKRLEEEMVGAIQQEIIHKSKQFPIFHVETIYFGGGSPSFISLENLNVILSSIKESFTVAENPETTIECNPDDISVSFSEGLKEMGFNRISLGIQSFYDSDLQMLNRAHNSNQIELAISNLKNAGFQNITIDLIYGLPGSNLERWSENLEKAIQLNIPHISSYCLTVEEKTLLHYQIENGTLHVLSDQLQSEQFELLMNKLQVSGYDQYEISNFARPGFESIHNSSYWKNEDYLGIGPSAHSKIGNKRFWNISNNNQFIKRFKTNNQYWEEEVLSEKDIFNELIMIGLRTKRGVSLKELHNFPFYESQFLPELEKLVQTGKIHFENDTIQIVGKNKFIADTIISDLFIV